MTASAEARAAVRAAKNVRRWGAYAALTYVERRHAMRHFAIAFQFEQRRKRK